MTDSVSDSQYEDCIDQASNDSRQRKKNRKKNSFKDNKSRVMYRKKDTSFDKRHRKREQISRTIERKQNEKSQVLSRIEPENVVLPKDRIRQYSNKSQDNDSNERTPDSREFYIDTMTKLIKLNMPSSREINRSNEAFMNREYFFKMRRRNTQDNNDPIEKNDEAYSNQLFSTLNFWSELVKCVNHKTSEQIKQGQSEFLKLLTSILHFQFELDLKENDKMDPKNLNNDEEYLSCFEPFYINRIDSAYKVISTLLSAYQNSLSNWPTSRAAFKYFISSSSYTENSLDETGIYNSISTTTDFHETMNTLQAWLTCCELLTSTINQIFGLIGLNPPQSFSESSFSSFVWFQSFVSQHVSHDDGDDSEIDEVDGEDILNSFQEYVELDEEPHHSFKGTNQRSRHNSLCMTKLEVKSHQHHHHHHRKHKNSFHTKDDKLDANITQEFGDNIDIHNLSSHEKSDQEVFEEFADIYQRRNGLQKLANMSIKMVEPVLKKFQLLFTITEKENKMPLTKTYAQIVKQTVSPSINNTVNNNMIYSEDKDCSKSEVSFESCTNNRYDTDFPANHDNLNSTSNIDDKERESMFEGDLSGTELSDSDFPLKFKDRPFCLNNGTMDSTGSNGDQEWRGLFGINNDRAATMQLPPLLIHYLFLAKLPVNLMHTCIKKILSVETAQKLSSLSKTSVKQKITYMKEALQYTLQARKFFQRVTHGINFQWTQFRKSTSPSVLAPPQDCEHSEFVRLSMKTLDCHLSDLLKFYMDCLKDFLNKSYVQQHQLAGRESMNEPRELLETEWKFVKAYCHSVKQEEDIVASSFCKLTEHLFDLLKRDIEDDNNNFLNLTFENSQPINNLPHDSPECVIIDSSSSMKDELYSVTSSLSMEMSESCQKYNNVCKVLKSRLKQANEFAKRLRADLEVSIHIELNSDTTVNNFLTHLSHTKHKLVTLHQPGLDGLDHSVAATAVNSKISTPGAGSCRKPLGQSDLSLVIPDECSGNLVELLHQLTTGFAQQIKEDHDKNDPNCCSPINGLLNTNSGSDINIDDYEKCPREYMLVINKNDKINWSGEKYPFVYELDMDNLKHRLETGKILFVARNPDQLLIQLKKFLDQKIVKVHSTLESNNSAGTATLADKEEAPATGSCSTFKDVIVQPCAAVPSSLVNQSSSISAEKPGVPKSSRPLQILDFQSEACHNNTKMNLNALKSKVIEIGSLLLDKLVNLTKTIQMKVKGTLEESVNKVILNSYSILFEFYLDMIRICTGDSFKNTIDIRVKNLYEHWFQFVFTSISTPERPPRCVYSSLFVPFFQFLLQIFKTWVPFNMSAKDWKEFRGSIDKFVKQYVGSSSRMASPSANSLSGMPFHHTNSCPKFRERTGSCSPNPRRRNIVPDPVNNFQGELSRESIMKWMPDDTKNLQYCYSDPDPFVARKENLCLQRFKDKQFSTKTNNSTDPAFSPIRANKTMHELLLDDQGQFEVVNSNQSTVGTSRHFSQSRITRIKEIENDREKKYHDEKLIGRLLDTQDGMSNEHNMPLIKKVHFKWQRKQSDLIGTGRTSNVFLVYTLDPEKPTLPQCMAMKEIILTKPVNVVNSENKHEYALLSKLQHDSLVRFYGADISWSHYRLFMEYCAEGTIAEICKNQVLESELRRWTKQILSVLVYIHGKNIVHRDLKPENIFLVKPHDRLNVKLGDLGHATLMKQIKCAYGTQGVVGTTMYMAPEVVLSDSKDVGNEHYNEKVDIWSMGCVVIYMMTGKPPWSGETLSIHFMIGQKNKPTNLVSIKNEARTFAEKCLNPEFLKRPSALDLMEEEFVQITE